MQGEIERMVETLMLALGWRMKCTWAWTHILNSTETGEFLATNGISQVQDLHYQPPEATTSVKFMDGLPGRKFNFMAQYRVTGIIKYLLAAFSRTIWHIFVFGYPGWIPRVSIIGFIKAVHYRVWNTIVKDFCLGVAALKVISCRSWGHI